MHDVIIVDDNETFRSGARFYLENILKYKVIAEFCNGVEYLNYKKYSDADIILMDIKMPKMNGIEAAKRSLALDNTLKIIAVTDYQDKVYELSLIKNGFMGLVQKRNIYQELQHTIEEVIKGKMCFKINV